MSYYGYHIPTSVVGVVDAADVNSLVDYGGSWQYSANHGVGGVPSQRTSGAVVQDSDDQLVAVYRSSSRSGNSQASRLSSQVILVKRGNVGRQRCC